MSIMINVETNYCHQNVVHFILHTNINSYHALFLWTVKKMQIQGECNQELCRLLYDSLLVSRFLFIKVDGMVMLATYLTEEGRNHMPSHSY